jgi:hypothetical protein
MRTETVLDNPFVQQELKPGEHLLWWGNPHPAHRIKPRPTFYVRPVIMGFLAIGSLVLLSFVWSLYQFVMDFDASIAGSILALFIACLLLFAVTTARVLIFIYQVRKHLTNLRNTTYAITDRRIMVITRTGKGVAVKSHTSGDIGQIVRVETGGGWGDISYGIPHTRQMGLRTTTLVDKMTGIPNAWMVEDILLRTFKHSQGAPQPSWHSPQAQEYPPQSPAYVPQAKPIPSSYPPPPEYYTQAEPAANKQAPPINQAEQTISAEMKPQAEENQ